MEKAQKAPHEHHFAISGCSARYRLHVPLRASIEHNELQATQCPSLRAVHVAHDTRTAQTHIGTTMAVTATHPLQQCTAHPSNVDNVYDSDIVKLVVFLRVRAVWLACTRLAEKGEKG